MEGSSSNDQNQEAGTDSPQSSRPITNETLFTGQSAGADDLSSASDRPNKGAKDNRSPRIAASKDDGGDIESQPSDQGPEIHLTLAFEELKLSVEAVLFAADRPLEVTEIRDIIGSVSLTDIRLALSDLGHDFEGRSVEIVELGRKYQLRTRQSFAPTVTKLFSGKPRTLSKSALETLAIVAYRQPVTRAEVNALRQVDSSQVMTSLRERELITPSGTRREPGNPVEYRTTPKFLEMFGLGDLNDLPKLRSLQMHVDTQTEVAQALKELNSSDENGQPTPDDLALLEDNEDGLDLQVKPEAEPTEDLIPSIAGEVEFDTVLPDVSETALELSPEVIKINQEEDDPSAQGQGDEMQGGVAGDPPPKRLKSPKRKQKPNPDDELLGLARPVYARAGASVSGAGWSADSDAESDEPENDPELGA